MSRHKDTITEDVALNMLAQLTHDAGSEGNGKVLASRFGPAYVRLKANVYSDSTYIIAHTELVKYGFRSEPGYADMTVADAVQFLVVEGGNATNWKLEAE